MFQDYLNFTWLLILRFSSFRWNTSLMFTGFPRTQRTSYGKKMQLIFWKIWYIRHERLSCWEVFTSSIIGVPDDREQQVHESSPSSILYSLNTNNWTSTGRSVKTLVEHFRKCMLFSECVTYSPTVFEKQQVNGVADSGGPSTAFSRVTGDVYDTGREQWSSARFHIYEAHEVSIENLFF